MPKDNVMQMKIIGSVVTTLLFVKIFIKDVLSFRGVKTKLMADIPKGEV